MIQEPEATVTSMVVSVTEYRERLAVAMERQSVSVQQLAAALDVSYQAVRNVLKGPATAFTAANNSKAAIYLSVDTDWLATGRGRMERAGAWPFTLFTPVDFQALDVQSRERFENEISGALQRLKQNRAA